MGKQFDLTFSEWLDFDEGAYHISRLAYTKEEAIEVWKKDNHEDIEPEDIIESQVKFECRSDYGEFRQCMWMVQLKGTKGSIPTWEYQSNRKGWLI